MKRVYALLINITLISSYSMAKTGKLDTKYEADKVHKFGKQSIVKRSKLVDYTVSKGDTLYSLAKKHHTTVSKIALINGLGKKRSALRVGESLKLPVEAPAPAKKKNEHQLLLTGTQTKGSSHSETEQAAKEKSETLPAKSEAEKKVAGTSSGQHKVVKGDSLYSIARKHHTTVKVLKRINHIRSSRSLKLGQMLKIPGETQLASDVHPTKKKQTIAKNEAGSTKKRSHAKKLSTRKIVIHADASSKKSFFERLSPTRKAPLKLSAAKKQLGKRYVWGATGPRSFDCSGFTSYVCKKSGVCIPRTSLKQSRMGKRISRSQLKPGDLVFFDTSKRRRGYVNHVGIYLGNNKFIHASSAKRKVIITSLEKPFYKSRFKWGSRLK